MNNTGEDFPGTNKHPKINIPQISATLLTDTGDARLPAKSSSQMDALVQQESNLLAKPIERCPIEWVIELLSDHIKEIVYTRRLRGVQDSTKPFVYPLSKKTNYMDEIKEAIKMPNFSSVKVAPRKGNDYRTVKIKPCVLAELRQYVIAISSMYKDNPFHNFEHACQVTESANKLLKSIRSESCRHDPEDHAGQKHALASCVDGCTNGGINLDPLTSFAVIFSAVIHDVDHRGVSNQQLINEAPELSEKYHNQSIAEQNSLDIAWNKFMSEEFTKLRCYLFCSEKELIQFRQLLVNIVLATDIFDKEANVWRQKRWDRAFLSRENEANNNNDLQVTIITEHIIQASDVSHTMQHWHVYRKWNQLLFEEFLLAFRCGRTSVDPSTFWYKGELDFFDNYVIPMIKKFKLCNILNTSRATFLDNAVQNRAQWEENGQDIVEEMMNALDVTL